MYLILCAFTLRQRPLRPFHWYFCIFVLAFSFWALSLNVYYYGATEENILFWGRLNYAVALWLALGILGFFYYFPRKTIHLPDILKRLFFWGTIVVFILTLFTPLIDQSETLTPEGPRVTLGELYILYLLVGVVGFGATFLVGIQKLKKLVGSERRNFHLVFGTFFATVIAFFISNGILPIFDVTAHLEYTFLIPLPISLVSFYSILRYRFLNIKFIITQSLKQALAFGGVFFDGLHIAGVFSGILFPNSHSVLIQAVIFLATLNIYIQLIQFFHSDTFHRFFGITPIEHFQKVLLEFKNANKSYQDFKHLTQEIHEIFCENYIQNLLVLHSGLALKKQKPSTQKVFFQKHDENNGHKKKSFFRGKYSAEIQKRACLFGRGISAAFPF
ncbi:hypothetical protein HC823_02385 [Candidatus Gracilibacteria bacterium]|nr:hypothetical protein [Candidatus Gracilibacteria bacterium]